MEVAVPAQGLDQGHEEEGQPADDEAAHHDAQSLGRSLLLRHRDPLPPLEVASGTAPAAATAAPAAAVLAAPTQDTDNFIRTC